MVARVLDALSGVDAEVIDLRWLDRASLDGDTVTARIRKTGNVLIAEQGPPGMSPERATRECPPSGEDCGRPDP
jgi:2-oxoisovalerate dehydrogenase E1 component